MAMGGSAPTDGNGMSTMNTGMDVPVFLIWGVGPFPPPFPKGKGGWSVCGISFVSKVCFGYGGFSFSPLGETGEGFGCEPITTRTMQVTRERWDECPSVFDL